VSGGRTWYLAGAVLAAAALGLPWSGQLSGAAHPARVAIVAGLVLAVAGLRSGRDRLVTAAAAAGAVGVLLGGVDPTAGRLALAGAVACLLLGRRSAGRRSLPDRPVRNPAG
jgi:membrane protein implicated in regulation of membrane protease activity